MEDKEIVFIECDPDAVLMQILANKLTQCESDTAIHVGEGQAEALSNWRNYSTLDDLVNFIWKCLTSENGPSHGRKIYRRGGLSLEQIVLSPEFNETFPEEYKQVAKWTLAH